jgi:hypothetical protein
MISTLFRDFEPIQSFTSSRRCDHRGVAPIVRGVLVSALACCACAKDRDRSSPDEEKAATSPADERSGESEPPKQAVEPPHPLQVTLLDAPGREPLPTGPRLDVWVAMDGIAIQVPGGEPTLLSSFSGGLPAIDPNVDRHLLLALFDALNEHPEKSEPPTLWIDERIPSQTITRVLYTIMRTGFVSFSIVLGKPEGREIVRIVAATFNLGKRGVSDDPWADLLLMWTEAGVATALAKRTSEAHVLGDTVALDLGAGDCILSKKTRVDPGALGKILDRLCAAAGGKRFAMRVALNDGVPFGDVLWALAADRRPDGCYLGPIVLAGEQPISCDGARSIDDILAGFASGQEGLDDESFDDGDALERLADAQGSKSGYGTSSGRRQPRVRLARATVEGSLDEDIIRRTIRGHVNEVDACYREALNEQPDLAGEFVVDFVIAGTGKVQSVSVKSSSLPDDTVATCTAAAIEGWTFPKPPRGNVKVTHPFVVSPGA